MNNYHSISPSPPQLVWGAEAIGNALGLSARQAFHLLESGKLPAKKVGNRWVARLDVLVAFFDVDPGA